MSEFKNLVCTSSDIRFPEQVKRIRADLNILGYDADEQTIQRAYEEWSEDYWASSWDYYSGQADRLDILLADYLKVSPKSPPTLPPVSPEDLVEGEWYVVKNRQDNGGKMTIAQCDMETMRFDEKECDTIDCDPYPVLWIVGAEFHFRPERFDAIYGPLRFKIGGVS